MKKVIVVLTLLLVPVFCHAQRTAKGTTFVSADAVRTYSSRGNTSSSFGGYVSIGSYTLDGYYQVGLSACRRVTTAYSAGAEKYDVPFWHIVADGAYFFRLFATRKHNLTFNLGAGVFLGIESIDPSSSVRDASDGGRLSKRGSSFLYGVEACAQAEWFFWHNLAIVPAFRFPVNFASRVDYFPYEASCGLRFNF